MRKEVIFAIIMGIGLGFVVTYGIWRAKNALRTLPANTPVARQAISPTTAPLSKTPSLILTSPLDNQLSSEEKIIVSGKASPSSTVIIATGVDSYLAQANEKGDFLQEISLVGGDNLISAYAFDLEGNSAEQELTVIYSTAEL